jgi:hypothetical protein
VIEAEEVGVNLAVLGGIAQLAQISEGKLHEQLTQLVTEAASDIDEALPEGVHIQISTAVAAR